MRKNETDCADIIFPILNNIKINYLPIDINENYQQFYSDIHNFNQNHDEKKSISFETLNYSSIFSTTRKHQNFINILLKGGTKFHSNITCLIKHYRC
ncbi:hypothetical protein BpHYR1_030765 [Brachionus plicatilis]|uniref:Uncharacterized protein n=1 Tax=Brachionus plicatilis TaxID=10195 RepID=A0A3M7PWE1_BRAPC|nr:hypothetical protein BpHYR1_030765 [Brachionus plicatilis]